MLLFRTIENNARAANNHPGIGRLMPAVTASPPALLF
jgi:hypothetical protein